jgi:thiol-disulfide isomerase/thioredoxin
MKRILLLIVCTLCLSFSGIAQTTVSRPTFDEKTIIKDSTGKVLDYNYWHPLILSGNYSVRRTYTKTDTSDYILFWLSPAKKQQFAQLRAKYSNQTPGAASNATAAGTNPATQQYVPTRLPQKSESFTNGEIFEPFKEKDIDGKNIDIKALQGKIIVINFWFIGCPACIAEIPELNEAVAAYANDPDVVFVGMCLDERWDIKKFLKQRHSTFSI